MKTKVKMIFLGTMLVLTTGCEKKEVCQGANIKRNQYIEDRERIMSDHASNHGGANNHYSSNVNGTKYNQEEYNAIILKEQAINNQEMILMNEKNHCKYNYGLTKSVFE